ncbi:MAG: hypothetical protein ACOWWO_13520 [Peptococcaceae bacterium]
MYETLITKIRELAYLVEEILDIPEIFVFPAVINEDCYTIYIEIYNSLLVDIRSYDREELILLDIEEEAKVLRDLIKISGA